MVDPSAMWFPADIKICSERAFAYVSPSSRDAESVKIIGHGFSNCKLQAGRHMPRRVLLLLLYDQAEGIGGTVRLPRPASTT